MIAFLQGWRRKVGCVTLLMACVFLGGWVRSSSFYDCAALTEEGLSDALVSYQGRIYGMRMIADGRVRKAPKFSCNSVSISNVKNEMFNLPELKWQFCGIGLREMSAPGLRIVVSEVSYWLIAIPLTLLSVYLLLSKSRVANEKSPVVEVA